MFCNNKLLLVLFCLITCWIEEDKIRCYFNIIVNVCVKVCDLRTEPPSIEQQSEEIPNLKFSLNDWSSWQFGVCSDLDWNSAFKHLERERDTHRVGTANRGAAQICVRCKKNKLSVQLELKAEQQLKLSDCLFVCARWRRPFLAAVQSANRLTLISEPHTFWSLLQSRRFSRSLLVALLSRRSFALLVALFQTDSIDFNDSK